MIVAVSGASGAGKTRLLSRLIPALARRGVSIAVLKHTRHPHAFDRPGKDTEILRRAGAVAAAIEGPAEMALFGPRAGGLAALARLLPPVDLVLAEGFRTERVPRIEVHRRCISREFLCARDPRVFAVVTDESPPCPVPALGPADVEPLADLLCARFGLHAGPRGRERLRVRSTVPKVRAEGSERTAALRRRKRMAKTKRKSSSSRGGRRSGASRRGMGRRKALRTRSREFYSEIGRKGGKSRRASRGGRSAKRGSMGRGGARGGSRSRRRSRSSSR